MKMIKVIYILETPQMKVSFHLKQAQGIHIWSSKIDKDHNDAVARGDTIRKRV